MEAPCGSRETCLRSDILILEDFQMDLMYVENVKSESLVTPMIVTELIRMKGSGILFEW